MSIHRQRRFRTFGTPWLLRCLRSWSAEPDILAADLFAPSKLFVHHPFSARRGATHRMEYAGNLWQQTASKSNIWLWNFEFPKKSIRFHQYCMVLQCTSYIMSYIFVQIMQILGLKTWGCLDYAPCSSWSKTWFNSLVFWNTACACGNKCWQEVLELGACSNMTTNR